MDWLWAVVAANPLAGMVTVLVTVIAGYVAVTLYEQYRAEVVLRTTLDRLKRERDKLKEDLQ